MACQYRCEEMPVMSRSRTNAGNAHVASRDKLAIEARKTGFDEIYLPFRADQAQREASRCLSSASTAFVNGPARCITISAVD